MRLRQRRTTWPHRGAMTSAGWTASGVALRKLLDARRMTTGFEKTDEVGGRDRSRPRVFERMEIERVMRQHCPLQHHRDAPLAIVSRREGRDAAGSDPQHLIKQLGRTE